MITILIPIKKIESLYMLINESIKYCFDNYLEFDYLDLSKELKILSKENKASIEILFIDKNKLIFILEDMNIDESYKILITLFKKINYYEIGSDIEFKISASALNIQKQELNKKYNKNLHLQIYKF